jgi:outer membrane lipoprotein-sorting protein
MRLRAAILLVLTSALGAAATTPESLETVLGRMDRAAASFKDMSADVRWLQHTAAINQDAVDIGTILLKRSKRDIRMRVEFTAPDRKSVALQGHKLEIYYPNRSEVEEYDTGKYREMLEQFLLIGFGTSGKELAAAYTMKVLGNETVEGQPSVHLELIPKSAEMLKNLKKLEMWIADTNLYPAQQKFYLLGGDYRLVTYTNLKVNTGLRDADLALKLPKDVKRVTPQK